MSTVQPQPERPAYRYLEALPPVTGRLMLGLRWGLLAVSFLWALIFLTGFLVAKAIT